MNSISHQIDELRIKVNTKRALLERDQNQLKNLQLTISNLESQKSLINETLSLARKCVEESLQRKVYLEKLVTSGLYDIFEEDLKFKIPSVEGDDGFVKGVEFTITSQGGTPVNPMNAEGAGVVMSISLLLQIGMLLSSKHTAWVMIADEVMTTVHPSYHPRLRALLEKICEKTGLQLISVTHLKDPFGKIYHLSLVGKGDKAYTKIKEIENAFILED